MRRPDRSATDLSAPDLSTTERPTGGEYPGAAGGPPHGGVSRRALLGSAAALGIAGLPLPRPRVAAATAAASTAQDAAAGEPTRGGTLTIASIDVDMLDIHYASQAAATNVWDAMYQTLVGRTPDGGVEPILAESWEVSDDNRQITFRLRQGVRFHDGNEVDAAAVKFSFDRLIEAWYGTDVITGVEAVDARTVRFQLAEPYAPIFADLTDSWLGIVSPAAVERAGDDFANNPLDSGSGPFKFKEWVVGQRIVLERYDGFQDFRSYVENKGAPYLDALEMLNVPEAQTLIASFEVGETDVVSTEGNVLDRLKDDPAYSFFVDESGTALTALWFAMRRDGDAVGFKPPLDDVRLRQAIGYAVNPQEIIDGVLGGQAIASNVPLAVGTTGYDSALGDEFGFRYDPARAAQLLDEAGWSLGADGVREKDGARLDLQLWTNSETVRVRICEILQFQLAQVGIAVAIEAVELGSFLARLEDVASPVNLYLLQWGGAGDPDSLYAMTSSETDSGLYSYQDYNAPFSELVTQARGIFAMEERLPLYAEAQVLFLADPMFIPLLSFTTETAVRPEVKGFKLGPLGYYVYQDVYLADA